MITKLKFASTILALSLSTPFAWSQAPHPKGIDGIQWGSNGSWYLLPFSPNRPAYTFQNNQLHSIYPPTGQGNGWSFADGQVWFIGQMPPTSVEKERVILWHRGLSETGGWKSLGNIDTQQGFPVILYKLKDDAFLGINWVDGFHSGNAGSFAALFNLKKDGLEFDHLVMTPFEDAKSTLKVSLAPPSQPSENNQASVSLDWIHPSLAPTLWEALSTSKYIFVIASKPGVIWIFNRESGEFTKTLNLSGLPLKDLDKISYIDHFILCAQPTPDGDLLLATRDPQVLKLAIDLYTPKNPGNDEDPSRSTFADVTRDLRSVRWMILDHANLEVHETSDPSYPAVFGKDYSNTKRFQFLLTPDGRVHTKFDPDWTDVVEAFTKEQVSPNGEKHPKEASSSDTKPAQATPPAKP